MFQFFDKATASLAPSQHLLFKTLVKSRYIKMLFGATITCGSQRSAFYSIFPLFHNVLIILFLQFKNINSSNISVFL